MQRLWAFLRGRTPVAEQIGEAQRLELRTRNLYPLHNTVDWRRADYAFWDKARRGRAQGLEVAGLFLKPLASKTAAWTLGQPPRWRSEAGTTAERLNEWWNTQHAHVLRAYEEAVGLGDCYVVVNPDLSVTVVPPQVAYPLVDDMDFSRVLGWRLEERFPHPTEPAQHMVVRDDFLPTGRARTVIYSGTESTTRYRNLTGLVPVIQVANRLGVDERFGRPEGEALLALLHRYGEIFDAALDGNIRQGRATPVMSKLGTPDQVEAFWGLYGRTETRTLPDGTTETVTVIDFNPDDALTLGGDATFDWKQPGSFSKDTEVLLGLLFYLLLQHTEIPEFVWGNAIASSKASAESQMPPFARWIEKKRGVAEDWMQQLARVVVATMALSEPGLQPDAELTLTWEPLTGQDDKLTLDTLSWAYREGLLDDETALQLAPLDVPDVRAVLDKAKEERDQRAEEARQYDFQQSNSDEIDRLEATDDPDTDPGAVTELVRSNGHKVVA